MEGQISWRALRMWAPAVLAAGLSSIGAANSAASTDNTPFRQEWNKKRAKATADLSGEERSRWLLETAECIDNPERTQGDRYACLALWLTPALRQALTVEEQDELGRIAQKATRLAEAERNLAAEAAFEGVRSVTIQRKVLP